MRIVLLQIVLVAGIVFSTANAFAFKVAVVDLRRILLESEAGKVAMNLIETASEQKRESLEKATEDLKRMKDEYDQKAAVLTEKARMKMEQDMAQRQMQLQQMYQQYQQDLQQKDSEMTNAIFKNVDPILKKLAASDGFDLILEKNEAGILWAPEKVDVTERVLRLYNAAKK